MGMHAPGRALAYKHIYVVHVVHTVQDIEFINVLSEPHSNFQESQVPVGARAECAWDRLPALCAILAHARYHSRADGSFLVAGNLSA